ncbi:glycoside hydrolase family 32 protein [Mucilaginibacter sp. BJC16-A38]|uniref:glycoside hydrolase family 32 protein n=1 Tax=Mucilaginibacter phenanthrenivorans TaxID=1234842 RepID=UPI0021578EF5|nr:glycoside hydrolase family 32 protein [Mucilaginibacter phenanthrenivorans]MCR8558846.1 glycoside hydrolase family 32 protein [Mucilaginibacter phenanthrenivorans]
MKKEIMGCLLGILLCIPCFLKAQDTAKIYHEQYRPQIHFSPQRHWINDPNGMVFYKGTYHLFFQYYPDGTTWGPMHWGHAVSQDLMHWKELPIALYPDSLGYIFSGSAVADSNNTSGFGNKEKMPLVAIFTNHDPVGEKEGKNDFQNQSLAYSLDNGFSWTKYSKNPVLRNPGIRDFRDPKVIWYAMEKKWVMTLATKDRITFYSSPDLKSWKKESEFGEKLGAHGGVWECPDLFPMKLNGKTYWTLIVNVNPGGPNGGSATQYFIGHFDGNKFTQIDSTIKWLDYGPDEYAGVTWSNTGARRIFLGWMSNWEYANQVPTKKWRNAMTIPKELGLKKVGGRILLTSNPLKELTGIERAPVNLNRNLLTGKGIKGLSSQFVLKFNINKLNDYSITLSNDVGEALIIGYDNAKNQYFIHRAKSGKIDFNPAFSKTAFSPRLSNNSLEANIKIVVDVSSIELFADDGLTVMTSVFFPTQPFNQLHLKKSKGVIIKNLKLLPLKSIW